MQAQRREQRVTFGPFCVDLSSGTLAKHGTRLRIPDQSVKVLIALLETPGTTVSRDELRARLWAHGTHVEFDQSLNSAVKRLRTALCDTAISPKYIETQPKRGYRFVHPVQTLDGEFGNSVSPVATEEVALEALARPATDTARKLRLSMKVRILLLLLTLAVLIPALRLARRRYWAYKEAIPRAGALAETGEWSAAFQLALEAAARLPADDNELQTLLAKVSREVSIVSEPAGVEVFWRPYADRKSNWRSLGRTPLHNVRLEMGTVRLRLTQAGYSDLEIAAQSSSYDLRLEPAGQRAEMVKIPAGPLFAQFAGAGKLGPVMVDEFWIDRHEVSNRDFQKFVNAGGYRDRGYWRIPFVANEHVLSWDQAMARFCDRTGRPSPAAWDAATYPAGQSDYPVSGVSWYEAAAYAAFAGKALPNIYEWFRAAAPEESASMVALSNYAQRGPLPVARTGAVGRFGTHDMAGNVREWCFNGSGGQKFILGGSWSDPAYMFVRGQKLEPFDRSVLNGFRCVKRAERPVDRNRLLDSIPAPSVDEGIPAEPSEEVFAASSLLYRRDHTDLQPLVESTTLSRNWRRETLRFPNGRGKDQLFAYLFLPLVKRPRYQCIVYVPGGDAFQAKLGADIQPVEHIIRSGRAMLYPIFWGTYDRFRGFPSDPENSGYPPPMFIREGLIHWKNELGLSLDYIKRRADIGQIGYMGVSIGANFGPVLLSRETQFKAAVFLSGAMPRHFRVMPESNPVNFASHVTIPILMINGKYDSISTPQEQESMLQLLGTPVGRKKRVLVESGHSVSAPEVLNTTMRETLNWFDRFLGLP